MQFSEQEIERYRGLSAKELTDLGVCPTCFDRATGGAVFGDNSDKIIYRDQNVEVFLAGIPRAEGHTVISTAAHYRDLSEVPDDLANVLMLASTRLMRIIREVYGCERVYLCSMCDGPANHCHLQLIPRYAYEARGSTNFVKPRFAYRPDPDRVERLRALSRDLLV